MATTITAAAGSLLIDDGTTKKYVPTISIKFIEPFNSEGYVSIERIDDEPLNLKQSDVTTPASTDADDLADKINNLL